MASIAVALVTFDSFSPPSAMEIRRASAAVVFTGAFERVDAGLQLLDSRAVPRLFISGVNGNAGISPLRFVSQFSTRNLNIRDLQELKECCVQFGERADNTFQNALETKCWINGEGISGPLLLITSRLHMARARAALSGALPDHALIPYPVPDGPSPIGSLKSRASEYLKYLGTIIAVRIPWVWGTQEILGPFARGCPAKDWS
jgi:uncharacterized SAM-binding protein YcdF (DUF218 family)